MFNSLYTCLLNDNHPALSNPENRAKYLQILTQYSIITLLAKQMRSSKMGFVELAAINIVGLIGSTILVFSNTQQLRYMGAGTAILLIVFDVWWLLDQRKQQNPSMD